MADDEFIQVSAGGKEKAYRESLEVVVFGKRYPSLFAAYKELQPNLTFVSLCRRIRNGMPVDDAFAKPVPKSGGRGFQPRQRDSDFKKLPV